MPSEPEAAPALSGVSHKLTIILIAVVALLFVWLAAPVLMMAFASVLVAVLLNSLAKPLSRWTGLGHGPAIAAVLVSLVVLITGLSWWVVPSIGAQVDEIVKTLPQQVRQLSSRLERQRWARLAIEGIFNDDGAGDAATTQPTTQPTTRAASGPASAPSSSPDNGSTLTSPEVLAKRVGSAVQPVIAGAGSWATSVLGAMVSLFIIVAASVYLALDPGLYRRGAISLVPMRHRDRVEQTFIEIGHALRWWLIGQGVTMIVIGVLTGVGLWLIGVRLWLTFGILAGVFNFVPNFGPLVSFLPAILFALGEPGGLHKVYWITGLYVVAQTFEGYVLTPNVQKRAVDLPPALLILFQVLAGTLLGSVGLMLAAPLLVTIIVAANRLYVQREAPTSPPEAI